MTKNGGILINYLERATLADLSFWLKDNPRKPLILRGARQVGKSSLVRAFCQINKRSLFEINFEQEYKLKHCFESLKPEQILKELEYHFEKIINPEKDLLFLDEIQTAPQAIMSLRYFYEQMPVLPVLAAGSLLDFALAEKKISVPVGRIEYGYIRPFSFEEFLLAKEEKSLFKLLQTYEIRDPFPQTAHEKLSQILREYFFVGGMPEAVKTHLVHKSEKRISNVHASLLKTYRDDFGKYAQGKELLRTQKLFDRLPALVGKKVKYSEISREEQAKEIREVIDLLSQARIIYKVHHTHASGIPLAYQSDDRIYKIYFLDIGLLNHQLGLSWSTIRQSEFNRFLTQGIQTEQFVFQNLFSSDFNVDQTVYYWLREGKATNAELDFVISLGEKIIPIEVKSGKSGSLRSLHQFVHEKNSSFAVRFDLNLPSLQKINHDLVTPNGSASISFQLLSLPIYFVGQLKRFL